MADDDTTAPTAADDGRWVAMFELFTELESAFPGISERVYDRVAKRAAFTAVVRLYGQPHEPRLRAAYREAEARLGVIATLAPQQLIKRKRRRE